MRSIASITAERNGLLAQATRMVQLNEVRSTQQKADYKSLLDRADTLSNDLAMLATADRSLRTTPAPAPAVETAAVAVVPEKKKRSKSARNTAYRNFLMRKPFEKRDVTTSSSGDNGAALIAEDFQSAWTAATKQYGPLLSLIRMVTKTDGSPTRVPLADPTSQTLTYLAEDASTSGIEQDATTALLLPYTDTLVSFTKASLQLFEDAEVTGGLEGFIRENLMGIVARGLEQAVLSGTDGSDTDLPNNPGYLNSAVTGATMAGVSAITYVDLQALWASLDASYRSAPGAAWYASQVSHDKIAGILDSENRPIFKYDDAGLLRVFGKPVYIAGTSSGMPSIGTASSPVVLLGDFSRAIVAVQRPMETRVLRERFIADSMEYGYVSHARIGSAVGIADAVKALVTPAS